MKVRSTNKKGTSPKIRYDTQIRQTNEVMMNLKTKLQAMAPSFGSHMQVNDVTHCHDALVAHRIVKKFSPKGDNTRDVCFANYKQYDSELSKVTADFNLWGPKKEHLYLRKASVLLRKWCSSFTVELHAEMSLEFTPGESFNSTRGDCSKIAKLFNVKHWTIPEHLYDLGVETIYYNRTLKYIARRHIGSVSPEERKFLYKTYSGHPDVGFAVFSHLLEDRKVLQKVEGARASSVPKNTETDRFINVESLFSVILQRAIARVIRRILSRKSVNNTLDSLGDMDAQALHGYLISKGIYATIDFSNASDSVILSICKALLPESLYAWLDFARSPMVLINEEWYEPNKLSSMGNGFTFEVMSLILYAIASSVSSHPSRVFGDDVIIHNDDAESFIQTCALIGFQTNQSKTFINSPFRESCGKFYHDSINGYLLSYEMTWCESFSDVCVTHNKLYRLSKLATLSPEVRKALRDAQEAINVLCLASQKGPAPVENYCENNLSLYIWSENAFNIHRKDAFTRDRYRRILDKRRAKLLSLCIGPKELTGSTVTSIPVYVPLEAIASTIEKYAVALLDGRSGKRILTGRGRWVNIPAVVFSDGYVMLVRSLYDSRSLSPRNRKNPTQLT